MTEGLKSGVDGRDNLLESLPTYLIPYQSYILLYFTINVPSVGLNLVLV